MLYKKMGKLEEVKEVEIINQNLQFFYIQFYYWNYTMSKKEFNFISNYNFNLSKEVLEKIVTLRDKYHYAGNTNKYYQEVKDNFRFLFFQARKAWQEWEATTS